MNDCIEKKRYVFNFYCDESCHLENDHKDYMVIGYICVPLNRLKYHKKQLSNLIEEHHFYNEIKWSKISTSKLDFYKELVTYFFKSDLKFRVIIVDKSKVNNNMFNQTWDDFYYKMYYQLLHHRIGMDNYYNVYIDIKDSLSSIKVQKLKDILNTQFGVFKNVQNIHSHENVFTQLCDVLTGVLSYYNNSEVNNLTKKQIITLIKELSNQSLDCSSNYTESKFNLFYINL